MTEFEVRKTPCASCPYRRDVPSGVWAESEYEKLRGYDGSIQEQAEAEAFGVFNCHQGDGQVCAGWAGCHDMSNNLAVRLAARGRNIAPLLEYTTTVPLFSSGNEAADHGEADIGHPSEDAMDTADKIARVRELK